MFADPLTAILKLVRPDPQLLGTPTLTVKEHEDGRRLCFLQNGKNVPGRILEPRHLWTLAALRYASLVCFD